MDPSRCLRVALLLLAALLPPATVAARTVDSPGEARLVTADLARFWRVWEAHDGRPGADALQAGYLDPGTPGLQAFLALRIGSARQLAETIGAHPGYYASLRGVGESVEDQRAAFQAAFEALEALYPPAVFPDTYFLIGRMNSAGTLSDEGLLIGLDMHGRQPGVDLSGLSPWHQGVLARPGDLPRIVAHELVHYQQSGGAGQPTLLQQAVREGSADFIAERIAGGHINALAHRHGLRHECELWREFEPRMAGTDYSGFLYGGDGVGDRPADLGYFIGYRIVQSYVERHGLSEATLRAVLGGVDAATLLREGGYAPCGAGGG